MLHLLAWGNILILLCLWVPYGTRCQHMPNIESYFLKFSQPKGHWKICTFKALNFGPWSSTSDLIYHAPLQLLELFFFVLFQLRWQSYNNQCSESCNLSYSLVVYPICTWKRKSFVFHFSVLTLHCLFSCLLHTCNYSKVFWCSLFTVFVYDFNWFFALL